MLRNVKEGRSWKLFSHHSVDISGEESYEWVACRIILSAPVPVPVPFLWTLDLGFGTWIWDLELGLEFGTGLGLHN